MADTSRSVAALQVLFADNVAEEISPQDLRDFLVSVAPMHGELSITATAETSITGAGWFLVAGTYGLTAGMSDEFDEAVNGYLRYTGTPTRMAVVTASISKIVAGNSKHVEFAIAKNGTVVTTSIIGALHKVGVDEGVIAVQSHVSMVTNDTVAVFARNTTDTTNFTAEHLNLQAIAFIE